MSTLEDLVVGTKVKGIVGDEAVTVKAGFNLTHLAG